MSPDLRATTTRAGATLCALVAAAGLAVASSGSAAGAELLVARGTDGAILRIDPDASRAAVAARLPAGWRVTAIAPLPNGGAVVGGERSAERTRADLFVTDGTGALRRLTRLGDAYAPVVAREAGLVVFARVRLTNDGARSGLWSVRIDGSGLALLAPPVRRRIELPSSVSPDGRMVLVSRSSFGATQVTPSQILIRDLAAGGERRLASGVSGAFSPDGTHVAFGAFADAGEETDLAVIPTAGGPVRRIAALPGSEFAPSWSPDGTRLVFSRSDDAPSSVWTVGVDGACVRPVARDLARFAGYGPAGWGDDAAASTCARSDLPEAARRVPLTTPGLAALRRSTLPVYWLGPEFEGRRPTSATRVPGEPIPGDPALARRAALAVLVYADCARSPRPGPCDDVQVLTYPRSGPIRGPRVVRTGIGWRRDTPCARIRVSVSGAVGRRAVLAVRPLGRGCRADR